MKSLRVGIRLFEQSLRDSLMCLRMLSVQRVNNYKMNFQNFNILTYILTYIQLGMSADRIVFQYWCGHGLAARNRIDSSRTIDPVLASLD